MASQTWSILRAEWSVHQRSILAHLAGYRLARLTGGKTAGQESRIIEEATAAARFINKLEITDLEETRTVVREALAVAEEFRELIAAPGTNLILIDAQDEFTDSAETLALAVDPETAAARAETGPRVTSEEARRRNQPKIA